MYYKKDLEIFHPKRIEHTKLQILRQKRSSAKEIARSTWRTFWEKTTIHGVRNTSDPTMEIFERIIWGFIVFGFTCGSLYCFIYYLEDYNAQVTRTVVEDSEYNVFKLSFPSIVICSRNRLNWKKMKEVQEKYLPSADENTNNVFREFISSFDGLRFGLFDDLRKIEKLNLDPIKHIDVSHVLNDLSMTCEDVFSTNSCLWKGIKYDCCDLFFEEKTEAGVCLVFNSVFSEDSKALLKDDMYYPFANAQSGEGSGIQVVITIDPNKERPDNKYNDGIWMMIKNPFEWSEQTFFIRAETETSVIITPKVTISDEGIKAVPINQRRCVFTGEENNKFYSLESGETYFRKNCITQCHQWYLTKQCNCTISIFFSQQTLKYRECTPKDYLCIYKNKHLFSNDLQPNEEHYVKTTGPGMTCPCFRNCDNTVYQPAFNSLPIPNIDRTDNDTTQYIFMDIYYNSDVILKYQTYLDVHLVNFLSTIGGLVSLFMGASLTSFTEATYYIIYATVKFLKSRLITESHSHFNKKY